MTARPPTVSIGMGSCGLAAGSAAVWEVAERWLEAHRPHVALRATGCAGACYREVLVGLPTEAGPRAIGPVAPHEVEALFEAHFLRGEVPEEKRADLQFLAAQERVALIRCGHVDPTSLSDYLASGGFTALRRVLADLSAEQVVAEVEASGLRGRGGAGFPTGRKWRLAREASSEPRWLVCNADEGDPGAFMDRNLVEGDPFAILEGMAIGAYGIGASRGLVYVRAEYPLAVRRLEHAIDVAREAGWLGNRVGGTAFSFDVELRRGAGAFVCGEETALIASLEGRRGIPRRRPPYPVERGLGGGATCINNVETFANVPWILLHGADAYRRLGRRQSRGTKVFSIAGDVLRTGLCEVPMGMTIRELLEGIGGGSRSGLPLKAVQLGGPSGGCLPAHLFDTPIDYESLRHTGAIMGSGGLVALDESRCMVDIARYFLAFTQHESCGKCTFCRLGTKRMLEVLDRIRAGEGRRGDLELLESLGAEVTRGSLCGLGRTAPNPVLTTLRFFRAEYEAHLQRRSCPTRVCTALTHYAIDPFVCDGCTLCHVDCPSQSIHRDERAIGLHIDAQTCVRCGGCRAVCQFDAVSHLPGAA